MLDVVARRTAHAADHAVAARAAFDRDSRALDQLGDALHFVNGDFGLRDFRLRAVRTILGADAALRVAQHANLHAASEGGLAHAARRGEQVGEPFIGAIEDCRGGLARDFFSSENFFDHAIEIDFLKLQHHLFLVA